MPPADAVNGESGSCLNEAAAERRCVVDVVGGHGPWQFRHWAIFSLASLCCSLHLFSTLPLAHSSSCSCAESQNGSLPSSSICNLSNCSTRENEMKWNELREPCFSPTPQTSLQLTQQDTLECTNAGSVFYAKCLFAVGSTVSTFVSYPLMKRFGGRSVCLTSCFLLCSCSVAGVWALTPAPFLLLKLVMGAALVNVYLIAAFSLTECVTEEFRLLYFFTAHLSWSVAHFILPSLSWILPSWAYFSVILTIPCFLLLLALCFLPETAESYASRGLMSRAHKVMRHAAKCNGFSLQGVEHFSPNLLLKEREEDDELRLVWKEPRPLLQHGGLFLAGFLSTFVYLSMMWVGEWLPLKRASFFSLMGTSEVAASLVLLSLSYFVTPRRVWALTSCLSSVFLIIMYVKESKVKPKFSRGFHLVQMFFASASWTLILVHVLSRPLASNKAKCLLVGAGICTGFLAATLADMQKLTSWNPVLLLIMAAPNLLLAIFAAFIPNRYLDGLNI